MDSTRLINLLADIADGQPHEIASLAASHKCSVEKIEADLRHIESMGLPFNWQGNRVQLLRPLDLLDQETIVGALQPSTLKQLHDIHIGWSVDSTNLQAMRGIEQGRRHGHVYLAEQQSAGRGRRGRQWVSPVASNIYLSAVWQFNGAGQEISTLSLVAGVAVCRALANIGITDVGLKWPNDILANGKKLGGILLEMQGDPNRECQVVVGIGLNVHMLDSQADTISQPWVDLNSLCSELGATRNAIVAAVLDALVQVLSEHKQQGFAGLKEEWQSLDVFAGQDVMIQLGEDYIFGVAKGVNQHGALRLETPSGEQYFHGGEVSLRPMGMI